MKKGILRILIMVIVIALLVGGGYHIYKRFFTEDQTSIVLEGMTLTQQKLETYEVDCLRGITQAVQIHAGDYDTWYQDAPNSNFPEGLFNMDFVQPCIESIDRANAAEPFLPELENIAINYTSTLRELEGLMAEAKIYYEEEQYEEDDLEGGVRLNRLIGQNFDTFFRFGEDLSQAVEKERVRSREGYLGILENEEDPSILSSSLNVTVLSETIHSSLAPDQIKDLSLIEFQDDLDTFELELNQLLTLNPSEEVSGAFALLISDSELMLASGQNIIEWLKESVEGNPDDDELLKYMESIYSTHPRISIEFDLLLKALAGQSPEQ